MSVQTGNHDVTLSDQCVYSSKLVYKVCEFKEMDSV